MNFFFHVFIEVVEAVRSHKDAYPFWDPVDVDEAPDYPVVIKVGIISNGYGEITIPCVG